MADKDDAGTSNTVRGGNQFGPVVQAREIHNPTFVTNQVAAASVPVVSRVFISSASGALDVYRQAAVDVCHRLHLMPVYMEEFDPQRPTPEQVCQQQVQSCDVFVLLLAHRYGTRPPGSQLSYTELEYGWAADRENARPEMPLLAFVVDPAFPWQPLDIDRGAGADTLARFVARVKARHEVKPLADVGAFRENLILALSRLVGVGSAPSWTRPMAPKFRAIPPYVGSAPFTGRAADLAGLDNWGRSSDPVMVVEAIGGTGKSALTWHWAQDRAPTVFSGLAGRLWWSFYDGSASMTRFLQELLSYVSARPEREIRHLPPADLAEEVIAGLREHPYLVVLDGFERLLAAYHRFDPSKLRDEEAETGGRSLIEANADEIVRKLTAAGPSKIMISTRLMPLALQSRFGQQLPGVRHLRLPGLTDTDTRILLDRLGVQGSEPAIGGFFGPLGNHPLLVGVVAGLVRDYRAAPGNFDRWLADPTAGGALSVPSLDLTQRRTHILAAALSGLEAGPRRLLGWISVLAGSVTWVTLTSINPFQPEPPTPGGPYGHYAQADRKTQEYLTAWRSSEPVLRARAQLDAALKDLEDRGLVWWDRSSNSFDLHPIIRAYAYDQLENVDRIHANDRVRDHFEALPPEKPAQASSVEDLAQTITIFRALIGAHHFSEASSLWQDFGRVLLDLGAHATVIELLGPLAAAMTRHVPKVHSDLAIAYGLSGRYEEAIRQCTSDLAETLKDRDSHNSMKCLLLLGVNFRDSGAHLAAWRCLELAEAMNAAGDGRVDGGQCLYRAIQAVLQGRVGEAHVLLSRAEGLPRPSGFLWFRDSIEYWRLYLALVADQSLTHTQLTDAATHVRSWRSRRSLAALSYELSARQGKLEQALAAAKEHEQLTRNAGLEAVPAASAFLLSKLGRPNEATAAVEESLTRLQRIHPAQRPYRDLARALWELDRQPEAASYARDAYRQAWHDGPPNYDHWALRDARELLQAMDEPIPDLLTVDPTTVKVPLENEVRVFIRPEAKNRKRKYRKR